MYLVVVDGIRIAHLGDIGQSSFSDEQLKTLGHVTIVVTQLANIFSDISMQNKKAFKLMEQLNPDIVITNHRDVDTIKYGAEIWKAYYADVPLCVSDIKWGEGTKLLFLGEDDSLFASFVKPEPWPYP